MNIKTEVENHKLAHEHVYIQEYAFEVEEKHQLKLVHLHEHEHAQKLDVEHEQ